MVNLNTSGAATFPAQDVKKIEVKDSHTVNSSSAYSAEKQIKELHQKNIVDDYFRVFDATHSDIAIKNLIAARLQPSYQLPQIHDTQKLASKAKELLDFSLTI